MTSFCFRVLREGFLHMSVAHILSECIQGGYGETKGSGFVLGGWFIGSGKVCQQYELIMVRPLSLMTLGSSFVDRGCRIRGKNVPYPVLAMKQ